MDLTKGLIIVTGNSKGKTTTALGYVMRALGLGYKVRMIQFLKGSGFSGELFVSDKFSNRFKIDQFGGRCRFSKEIKDGTMKCIKCGECFKESRDNKNDGVAKAMDTAWQSIQEGYDVFVLDEISHALNKNLLEAKVVKNFVDEAKDNSLVILTGRNMPQEFIDMADRATECSIIKHPQEQGIDARRGTEY